MKARTVPATTTVREMERTFLAEPDLACVIVEREGGHDMLTRECFFSESAGRLGFGRARHGRNPVSAISDGHPALVLPYELALPEAGRAAMRRDGSSRYDDVVVTPVADGLGKVSFGRLLGELSELHADRAKHDPLTGLPNRALLFERLETALRGARPERRPCLLFIDIDDFKQVNDSLGHPAGDELLIAIASRLGSAFRDCDMIGRLGGDEFVVLLSAPDEFAARAAADRVLLALSDPLTAGHRDFAVGASVGVALRTDETRPEQMLRAADLAMYEAKRSGKNRVGVYRPALHVAAVERLELRNALPKAIAEGQMSVAFQPIVNLETQAMHGVEALARWTHPERGPVSPLDFIRLAEETGEIAEIGAFVLRTTLGALRGWPELSGLRVGVNVSLVELEIPGYARRVEEILADAGFGPERLILEITESAFARDDIVALHALHELTELGVGLAMDDFGTGFSSLARLGELPIGVLKLDKRFIDKLARSSDRRLLRGLLGLAREMEIDVVAEGIEEPEQLEMLRSMGCRLGQGYLISRPMAAESVQGWAATRPAPQRG
ncbi:EAL domain-containing protein [Thermoleophilia bacterium SCSIO 60948]|nr:EAL domain-containing protein [Thermoleophilia bacterium SCSIO 60948]